MNNKILRLDYADMKYPASPDVMKVLTKSLGKINKYPDEGYSRLKKILSQKYSCEDEWFAVSNGLDEMIDLITRAYCREGDNVVIPIPTFSQFEKAAIRQNVETKLIPCMSGTNFKIDPNMILKKTNKKTRIIWLCSPNNPTGNLLPLETITDLLIRSNCTVVVDEALVDYNGNSCFSLVGKFKNLIVLRSLSKSYCIAGLRIGYAISQPVNIDKIDEKKQIFNVNTLAVEAAIASLNDQEYYDRLWKSIITEKERVIKSVERLGITIVGKESNMLLLDFKTRAKSEWVYQELQNGGIWVFPGWNNEFTGLDGRFLRVVIGRPSDNNRFIKSLREIIFNK